MCMFHNTFRVLRVQKMDPFYSKEFWCDFCLCWQQKMIQNLKVLWCKNTCFPSCCPPWQPNVPLACGVPLSACLSLNNPCRNHGAMDRHEYHSRSRSADQRPVTERLAPRSHSTERPHDSSIMRSMPSLPSGRSAPPSPAMTRCDPDWRG